MSFPQSQLAESASDSSGRSREEFPIPLVTELPDPLVGMQVGNFRLLRRLGQGGMATVYLAEHPVIGSQVAVKILHPSLATDSGIVRRFYAEARAAHRVAHQHIVQVLDLGLAPGLGLYLVMEYVPGTTLAQHLHGAPVSLDFAETVLSQVCSALDCAHERGIVHRDLKPDNILVVEAQGAPFVKVGDFGIAKLRDGLSPESTRVGDVVGTPLYMSPEQVQGAEVDARADIYALGVVAYELVTGRVPFQGSPHTLMSAHVNLAPQPPHELRADLPPSWNAAILRALAKEPAKRFPNGASFLAALRTTLARAPAQPPTTSALPVAVEFGPGVPAVSMRAIDVSRGGALICFHGPLPPLLSKVRVHVGEGEHQVVVDAEVVRHITEADAAAWKLEPGFAVQFRSAPAALDRAVEAVHRAGPRPPTRATEEVLNATQRARVERFHSRVAASHYEVLDAPFDASREKILERGKQVMGSLRELEKLPLSATEQTHVHAAVTRVAAAITSLGTPRERIRYDARLGNFRGIARTLAEGLSPDVLEDEWELHCASHRAAGQRTDVYLGRIKLARASGNLEAARFELEYALTGDPLHPQLHQLWAELQKQR